MIYSFKYYDTNLKNIYVTIFLIMSMNSSYKVYTIKA
jgi:hypothetical protein